MSPRGTLRWLLLAMLLATAWSRLDAQSVSAAWANDGEDKVTREETRVASNGAASVYNSVWNGTQISLFGARNEVVEFNLVLEAAASPATQVSVTFNRLTGPGGVAIASVAPGSRDGVFDWTQRNIELFYVRYLPIRGLSQLPYEHYDERHIPKRLQRPWTGDGNGSGLWTDRPDHDKSYPDIAVPLDLVPTFNIAQGQNQSIWTDVYIPSSSPAGAYTGTVTVREGATVSYQLPVTLTVRAFTLPDVPSSKTMVFVGDDMNLRYSGQASPAQGTVQGDQMILVRNRHFQVAHRHRLSLIDSNSGVTATGDDAPNPEWVPRLSGSLFTAANGYAGPGVSVGNGVFSIGTYGSWSWQNGTQADMWTHTNNWEGWFQANAPAAERFLYLTDEPAAAQYPQVQQWAQWMAANPGVGRTLKSFCTIGLLDSRAQTPALNITATFLGVGDTATWNNAVAAQLADASKRYFQYNGSRPAQGSFATEDDGVALRELSWAQYKKGIQRWFFWESTYYNDFQGGRGQTNVFQNAATFSGPISQDPVLGENGTNHSNGDGLLFYPGTDTIFAGDSYGVNGPFASLRMKHWRRGVQDVDYLTLAKAIDPAAVQALVNQMVPKAEWEYGVSDPADPTWVRTDISWSINPDAWEAARRQLANIIDGGRPTITSPTPGSTLGSSTVTFTWSAAAGATQYWLYVGTTAGGLDLVNQNEGANLSTTVAGLPTNGSTLYVRLWYLTGGRWLYIDVTYTAASGAAAPAITSPAPGSVLPSSTVTFTWSAGAGATQYWLYVGTTAGGLNLLNQNEGTNLSTTVDGLPTNGSTLYVRLWYLTSGTWLYRDTTFTAASGGGAPAMTSPTPGSVLPSSTVTFTWSAGSGATQYWLHIGSSAGGVNLFNQNEGTNLSATVAGLPTNGSTLYVRLWYLTGGTWLYTDLVYTASR